MNLQALALTTAPMLMLLLGLVPNRIANRRHVVIRNLAMSLVAISCLVAFGLAASRLSGFAGPVYASIYKSIWSPHLELSVYYDSVTALMLSLVTFLGLITCRFSVRYLDGEQSAGQYFKWMAFTIGAVSLMVVAGNMLLLLLAWFITSLGLHQLLTHYGHRPQARRAAWTKFVFSRLGDLLLLIATILIIQAFGSQTIPDIIAQSKQLLLSSELVTQQHTIIVWLLVLGAIVKTAQVPFHAWLPETLETPTPVSAFMHAGIVNAGGYMLIRINPILALESMALTCLAIVGAATACLGVVVMATQTSVKRSLAYSTVAQMGFMMLQCGVGAFSAAMLHLLAHSLYKAHAFLSSGTVDFHAKQRVKSAVPETSSLPKIVYLLAALACSTGLVVSLSGLMQLDLLGKQGGVLFASILTLALSSWIWKIFLTRHLRTKILGMTAVAGICAASLGCFQLMDYMIGSSVAPLAQAPVQGWMSLLVGLVFATLFLMQAVIASGWRHAWLERIRIHATSGFYFSALYQRFFSNVLAS